MLLYAIVTYYQYPKNDSRIYIFGTTNIVVHVTDSNFQVHYSVLPVYNPFMTDDTIVTI